MQKRICKSFANAFNNNCLFHFFIFLFLMFCSNATYQKRKFTRKLTCMNKPVQNKKAHPIKSDELVMFSNCLSCISDLSSLFRDGIGTFSQYPAWLNERGCQGVIGPLPSAFLDKCPVITGLKELAYGKQAAAKLAAKQLYHQISLTISR